MTKPGEPDPHHAALTLQIPRTDGTPYDPDRFLAWTWTDGRRTLTATERTEMERLLSPATNRVDCVHLDHGTVVARIWMNADETIDRVEWTDCE